GRAERREAHGPDALDELERVAVDELPVVAALARVSARVLGVADAGARANTVEQRVLLAVHADVDEIQPVARGRALVPELVARRGPEPGLLDPQRLGERLVVRVADEEHLAGVGVLQHDRHHGLSRLGDLAQLGEVERCFGSLFELVHGAARIRYARRPCEPGLAPSSGLGLSLRSGCWRARRPGTTRCRSASRLTPPTAPPATTPTRPERAPSGPRSRAARSRSCARAC